MIFCFSNSVLLALRVFLFERIPDNESEILKIESWYSRTVSLTVCLILVLIGIAFTLMFREIRKILFRYQKELFKAYYQKRNHNSKQIRALFTFGLLYLSPTLMTLPYFTLRFIIDLHTLNIPHNIFEITELLKEFIAFMNPILYITSNRGFRKAVKVYIFKKDNVWIHC